MKPYHTRRLIFIAMAVLLTFFVGCGSPDEKKKAFIEKGNQLFEQKDFVKAKLEYKNAIQIDPEFARAYYLLGKTELELKNFKQAYGMMMKAVELDPDLVEARIHLGKILMAGKAPDKALEQAEAVLAKDARHVDANLLKATVHFSAKEYDQGEAILQGLYQAGESSPDMFMMLSSLAGFRQDKARMRAYLKEGMEKNPDYIPMILTLAQLEASEKNYEGVERNLEKVIALQPDQIQHKISLAKVFMTQNKKAEAEKILEQALSKDTKDEKTRIGVAGFWVSGNDPEKAEKMIKEGLQISPESFDYRFFLGEIYTRSNRMDDAEMILRQAAALNPDPAHPDIIRSKAALANLLLARAKIEEGETLVDEVLKQDPKNVDAHFLKGKLFLSRNDGINAVNEFRVVTEDRPQSVEGHLNLAQAHILNKELDLAADVLEKARAKLPGAEVLLKAMARVNILKNNSPAAEANLQAAVRVNPQNLQSILDLGDFYVSSKRYDKALEQYQVFKEKRPDLPNGYLKAASVYVAQAGNKKALDEIKDAYIKMPDSAIIISSLVKLYLDDKDYDSALGLCTGRLEENDREAFTWNLLGGVHLMKKELEKARTAFEKAVEIQPDWGKPYDNLARVYLLQGEKDSAIKKFNDALQKDPGNMSAWMILGSLYEKDAAYDKAAQTYEQAFEKNPGVWAAANNYAFIMSELSKDAAGLQKAMDMALKAEKLNPGAGVVQDTLGWIHFKTGNLDQAHARLLKALEQHPDHNVLNYHMGSILDAQGKIEEAKLYLEKSLVSDNDYLGAETARKLLEKYNAGK